MIAIDSIEQMDAESLDLVNPDARKNGGTGEVEISGDFGCVQTAHLEIGHIILSKQGLPVASDAHGGGQAVPAPGKCGKRRGCLDTVMRFVQEAPRNRERLVSPQTIGPHAQRACCNGLGLGQAQRETLNRASFCEITRFNLPLVNFRRNHLSLKPGSGQQGISARTFGGQNKRILSRPYFLTRGYD